MPNRSSVSFNQREHTSDDAQKIISARHHDPFSYLGKHPLGDQEVIRAFIPRADQVHISGSNIHLKRIYNSDLYEWRGLKGTVHHPYQLEWTDSEGQSQKMVDPYSFGPQLSEFDIHLFGEGKHQHAYRILGAHYHTVDDVSGVLFATWAPNAERCSVVGDFNNWDGRCHPMRIRGGSGVWELFIPGIQADTLYKYEIRSHVDNNIHLKSDPYAQRFEKRPATSSIVCAPTKHQWKDDAWINKRQNANWLHEPMSIYEVHLGSWQLDDEGQFLNYRELAHRLVNYVQDMGFTHIELLPITEHPLDISWGYQTTGHFAPTSRFGSPDDFRYFIDYCHEHNIGVILDWVPGHFPKDTFILARYDGSALYEHQDPRLGEHIDWGTYIFNYSRHEVKNFLLSSALYWLEEFHLDGLRVDAVASMLYLDYSREEGQWIPNIHGGNENLDAISFIQELNEIAHNNHPGTIIAAEESTSYPMVSRPVSMGGLGFSMKWNMGWMNDTLEYMSNDPVHRKHHHNKLTFSQLYAYTENFILPFSHDEVVHMKKSMVNKMPGDEWQRFANLRLLYAYLFTHPGKKLLFMGCEFGQGTEWDCDKTLDWYVLEYPLHQGLKQLTKDLNHLYCDSKALHCYDFNEEGFEWLDCDDSEQSILSFIRKSDNEHMVIVINMTPVPRENYRLGLPENCNYQEALNSDSHLYGGSNMGNPGSLTPEPTPWMGKAQSINIKLPPLGCLILRPE